MKTYKINEQEFELIENYKEGFDLEEIQKKYTEYFSCYDYILGDWSYGKLRLKGFCNVDNKLFNQTNDINIKQNYLKNACAYECKYCLLKKITN
ncbi:MAG: YutD-like domain-containing protein [Bacilli bacterium]